MKYKEIMSEKIREYIYLIKGEEQEKSYVFEGEYALFFGAGNLLVGSVEAHGDEFLQSMNPLAIGGFIRNCVCKIVFKQKRNIRVAFIGFAYILSTDPGDVEASAVPKTILKGIMNDIKKETGTKTWMRISEEEDLLRDVVGILPIEWD